MYLTANNVIGSETISEQFGCKICSFQWWKKWSKILLV